MPDEKKSEKAADQADARTYVHPAHPLAAQQAREGGVAVVVLGGYVWEHDVDTKTGEPTSGLRPHYKEGQDGYPAGGYAKLEDVRAKHLAAVPVKDTQEARKARLLQERADIERQLEKMGEA